MEITGTSLKGGRRKDGKTDAERTKARRARAKRVFPFTIQDIAEVTGKSVYTIRRAIKRKRLDPRDLKSLSWYVVAHGNREVNEQK